MTYNFDFWMLVITTINVFAALFTWFISDRASKKYSKPIRRPIVGIVEFATHRNEKDEPNFMIKYKNFGKTPSRDTKIVFETYLNRKSIAVEQNPIYIFFISMRRRFICQFYT